jgi:hypothetical protein
LKTTIVAMTPAPIRSDARFARPSATSRTTRPRSRKGPPVSIDTPSSLGSWLISTVSAIPFMYP